MEKDTGSLLQSINRNILECKYSFASFSISSHAVLIETYWNVNIANDLQEDEAVNVLIETYWNVNMSKGSSISRICPVLIETYWNVNSSVSWL